MPRDLSGSHRHEASLRLSAESIFETLTRNPRPPPLCSRPTRPAPTSGLPERRRPLMTSLRCQAVVTSCSSGDLQGPWTSAPGPCLRADWLRPGQPRPQLPLAFGGGRLRTALRLLDAEPSGTYHAAWKPEPHFARGAPSQVRPRGARGPRLDAQLLAAGSRGGRVRVRVRGAQGTASSVVVRDSPVRLSRRGASSPGRSSGGTCGEGTRRLRGPDLG